MWCGRCGSYAENRAVGLARTCRGRPTHGVRLTQRRRLQQKRHPKTGETIEGEHWPEPSVSYCGRGRGTHGARGTFSPFPPRALTSGTGNCHGLAEITVETDASRPSVPASPTADGNAGQAFAVDRGPCAAPAPKIRRWGERLSDHTDDMDITCCLKKRPDNVGAEAANAAVAGAAASPAAERLAAVARRVRARIAATTSAEDQTARPRQMSPRGSPPLTAPTDTSSAELVDMASCANYSAQVHGDHVALTVTPLHGMGGTTIAMKTDRRVAAQKRPRSPTSMAPTPSSSSSLYGKCHRVWYAHGLAMNDQVPPRELGIR